MGVRVASVFTKTFIGPLPATAAETIVFTTGPLNLAIDGAQVLLFYSVDISAGTSVTNHVFIIRRGAALTSPNIMVASLTSVQAAPNRNVGSGVYFDNPGLGADLQYTLTIQQTGATAAGAFNDGCLLAMVL